MKNYSLLDRARILYNHIFFSDLSRGYKRSLLEDRFYLEVLKHRNFNPRLIEWLSKMSNVRSVEPSKYRLEVLRVLDNPEQLWQIAFEQQISESSRSVLLALYALSGVASLERLEPRWKRLHAHRAKKYNWQTSAEDWKRSLKELEGGFLAYDEFSATFVNPSVKDFFDSVMNTHVEHLEDLLVTSGSFAEVRNLWSLMMSDKGGTALGFISRSPTKFFSMVKRGLSSPALRRIAFPGGGYGEREIDTTPDARVATLVSVAVRLEARPILDMLEEYVSRLVEYWKTHQPDFDVATDILRALDTTTWLGARGKK